MRLQLKYFPAALTNVMGSAGDGGALPSTYIRDHFADVSRVRQKEVRVFGPGWLALPGV